MPARRSLNRDLPSTRGQFRNGSSRLARFAVMACRSVGAIVGEKRRYKILDLHGSVYDSMRRGFRPRCPFRGSVRVALHAIESLGINLRQRLHRHGMPSGCCALIPAKRRLRILLEAADTALVTLCQLVLSLEIAIVCLLYTSPSPR